MEAPETLTYGLTEHDAIYDTGRPGRDIVTIQAFGCADCGAPCRVGGILFMIPIQANRPPSLPGGRIVIAAIEQERSRLTVTHRRRQYRCGQTDACGRKASRAGALPIGLAHRVKLSATSPTARWCAGAMSRSTPITRRSRPAGRWKRSSAGRDEAEFALASSRNCVTTAGP